MEEYKIVPSEEAAAEIVDYATNEDHLKEKFKNFRPELEHPKSINGKLIQVQPEEEIINQFIERKEFVDNIVVIDLSSNLPRRFLNNQTEKQFKEFFELTNFDELDDCVVTISPFIGMYRGFLVEMFKDEEIESVLKPYYNDPGISIESYSSFVESKNINNEDNVDTELTENGSFKVEL